MASSTKTGVKSKICLKIFPDKNKDAEQRQWAKKTLDLNNQDELLNLDTDLAPQQAKDMDKISDQTVDSQNSKLLRWEDLKYNFWAIKLLTLNKTLPTELNLELGHLRRDEKTEKWTTILNGSLNIFMVFRTMILVLDTILSSIFGSELSSETEIHRRVFSSLVTAIASGLYYGYRLAVLQDNHTTATILLNAWLESVRKNSDFALPQVQHQDEGQRHVTGQCGQLRKWLARVMAFLWSLIRRPFRVNLLIYWPIIVYPSVFILMSFMFVDPTTPFLLTSYVVRYDPLGSGSIQLALFWALAVIDLFYVYVMISCIYYAVFSMLLCMLVTEEELERAVGLTRLPGGLEKGIRSLHHIQVNMTLFNNILSAVVYLTKLNAISLAVVGGFGFLSLIGSHPIFAAIYAFIFVEATVGNFVLFDKVSIITEKMEELKEQVEMDAHKTLRAPSDWKYYKKMMRSIPKIGIQAAGFYIMERENSILFGDFVLQKIVDLLLTF